MRVPVPTTDALLAFADALRSRVRRLGRPYEIGLTVFVIVAALVILFILAAVPVTRRH
jgi:hypothetical protein